MAVGLIFQGTGVTQGSTSRSTGRWHQATGYQPRCCITPTARRQTAIGRVIERDRRIPGSCADPPVVLRKQRKLTTT